MAPPPSGEFSITLTKPFTTSPSSPPTSKIEIIGEPNRPATINVTSHVGAQSQTLIAKEGACDAEDVNELMDLVKPLQGLPSSPDKDIYGVDARLVL
ncbi:MAG: hypothetical protein Q9222_007467, partial [Ikaeria aurantiellina]